MIAHSPGPLTANVARDLLELHAGGNARERMINHKLLHDPRETVAGVRQLYARVRATAYAVLIVPTPTGSRGAIARDVLRGLGKHLDGRDTPRTPSGLNDAARSGSKRTRSRR